MADNGAPNIPGDPYWRTDPRRRREASAPSAAVKPTYRFWMVARRDTTFVHSRTGQTIVARPRARHESLESALKEARRLAERNPESPFIVLEAIVVVSSDGTKTVCSEPIEKRVAPEQQVRP